MFRLLAATSFCGLILSIPAIPQSQPPAAPVKPAAKGQTKPPAQPPAEADQPDTIFRSGVNEVIVPVTKGKLDFGPWQQVYYAEFDGRRPKRVIIKVMGE